jgi:DNA-directed RNA polymerase subunit RPC12/RpoP
MPYQQRKPRSFGADDRLACPNCSKAMFLSRRGPDVDYERQIFTCLACDHRIERIADADGNPPGKPLELAIRKGGPISPPLDPAGRRDPTGADARHTHAIKA